MDHDASNKITGTFDGRRITRGYLTREAAVHDFASRYSIKDKDAGLLIYLQEGVCYQWSMLDAPAAMEVLATMARHGQPVISYEKLTPAQVRQINTEWEDTH